MSERFHLSTHSDVAYDCIADLFQQDENGVLVQVKTYFEGIEVKYVSEEVLLSHLRRLIFAKVNQGIFRIYSEVDPSLGKILRNIKLAIQTLHNFAVLEQFGEPCIAPSMCETLDHLPALEPEELESALHQVADGNERIPSLLGKLSLHLREQAEHSRVVPLIVAARVFRSFYSAQEGAAEAESTIDDRFVVRDALSIIDQACTQLKDETQRRYVGKKKVSADVFENYFVVIRQIMTYDFTEPGAGNSSFFEALEMVMPGLTQEEYQKRHRSKLEYLARLAHKRAVKQLRAAER